MAREATLLCIAVKVVMVNFKAQTISMALLNIIPWTLQNDLRISLSTKW